MPQSLPGFLIVIGVLLLFIGFMLGAGKVELGPIKLPKLGSKARPRQLWVGIFTLLGFGMYLAGCTPSLLPTSTTVPAAETFSAPSLTSTSTPTLIPTLTSTLTLTPTSPPPPLVEIFPQVDGGQEFFFVNDGGVLTSQFVRDQDCVHSGVYGLRITYSMEGTANGGWGAHWSTPQAEQFDASNFDTLTFWIRGAVGNESFQVAMKDTDKHEFWIDSRNLLVVPSTWILVSVPLSDFVDVNKSSLENISFGFNNNHGSGSVCIDDIAFAETQ